MKKQIILFVFSLFFLVSCSQKNKLSEEDYSWMPYKGKETLVFKSNSGEIDTIFFIRKDTLWGYPEPATSVSKYEVVAIFFKHSDPYMPIGHRYLENYFLKIKKTMSNKAELEIGLSAKDANFYRLSPIKIDSLSRVNQMPFTTSYKHYDDVYIIESEDYLGSFYKRSNYVTKLYWSRLEGLIRYDKKDGVYWELTK